MIGQEIDLSAAPIAEPINAYRVDENRFATAEYSPHIPHMVTTGISACKGIFLYTPETQKGLVAHLSADANPEESLDRMVEAYGSDLSDTTVHLVRAHQSDSPAWPTIDRLEDYFSSQNPHNLFVDNNRAHAPVRGFSLSLFDGTVSELVSSLGWAWSKKQNTDLNQPLRTLN